MSKTVFQHKVEAPKSLGFAIIICSSSRYEGMKTKNQIDDPSGDLISRAIQQHGYSVIKRGIVPDNKLIIENSVKDALDSMNIDVIITCGGTGLSPKDVTIEAIKPLFKKEIPGFGEILRQLSHKEIGSATILTRAIAGIAKGKAIFCLPGSPQAVSLSLKNLILPEASHIIKHARE